MALEFNDPKLILLETTINLEPMGYFNLCVCVNNVSQGSEQLPQMVTNLKNNFRNSVYINLFFINL